MPLPNTTETGHAAPWINPDLLPPAPVDAVIFDVDGVLFETSHSFDAAVKATTRDVLTQLFGQADPRPVSETELRLFRKAGGLNNDWDMAYTLIALRLAGRGETPEATAAAAAESGGRGRAWAEKILPADPVNGARLDYGLVVRIFNEYYWGAENFERVFGLPARYVADEPGLWRREVQLLPPDLPDQLREAGVRLFGIATGRTRDELDLVYAAAGLDRHVPEAYIMTGDALSKPDPRVLDHVLTAMNQQAQAAGQPPIRSALFCGDTMDDLMAVLNYRQLQQSRTADNHNGAGPGPEWVGAVAVTSRQDFPFFAGAGSDIAVEHIGQLLQVVRSLADRLAA